MNIVNYALYLDAKDGSSIEDLSRDYQLPPEYVREHVEAARLCFERQIQRVGPNRAGLPVSPRLRRTSA